MGWGAIRVCVCVFCVGVTMLVSKGATTLPSGGQCANIAVYDLLMMFPLFQSRNLITFISTCFKRTFCSAF